MPVSANESSTVSADPVSSEDNFSNYRPENEASVASGMDEALLSGSASGEVSAASESGDTSSYLNALSIPSSYNMEDSNTVPSVKNQNPYGNCWAFATFTSAESNLMMNSSLFQQEEPNFSEMQLAYYNFCRSASSQPSGCEDDLVTPVSAYSSVSKVLNIGSNFSESTMSLARWVGAVDETDAPQSSASAYTFNDSLMAYNDNSYVLENADYISLTDIASVKNEIMKHSIRWKLLLTGIALILGAFLIFGILNYFFLGKFYQTEKTKTLMDVYKEVNQIADTSTDFSTDIMKVSVENNIQILITDSDFNALNSTSRDTQELSARLFGYYTGFFNEGYTILKKTGSYTVQTSSDHRISLQYLEIWGQLDNSDWFLIRTPLESMQDAARLSIRFFIFIAIIVAAAAAVIIWFFSKRFTKPVTQLTELSKRMANQDFSAKYTGETNDEIGVLGTNFNLMSDELEGTISELKSANTELQKDNERKTQIDEVRKEFLNNVSHAALFYVFIVGGAGALVAYFGAPLFLSATPDAVLALRILAPTIFLSGILGVMSSEEPASM